MQASHLSRLYSKNQFGLLTDLYQLTMAYGYWKQQIHDRPAVFHLYFRKAPFQNHYAISAGLALAIDFLNQFRFTAEDVHYLGSIKGPDGKVLFPESFLNYLQRLKFSCDIDAIPEGTVVFPNQPLIRVKGPLLQAQLIETALLTIINFSTLIATKAARVVQAAQGDTVLEFGLRRAQGIDGGITASRSAYVGGCHATSNVLAGRYLGIPVKGTHAHSWVMCFESELESFKAYAEALPNNCIFLVDTYDTEVGIQNAIQVSLQLKEKGHTPLGIRLDSGDLSALSKMARQMLDQAGLTEMAIVASNDLNEDLIRSLKADGAKISVWGVGTQLATAYNQAALGGVYKLAALQSDEGIWLDKVKLSENPIKTSTPGIQQVRRFYDEKGMPIGDQIFDEKSDNDSSEIILFNGNTSEKITPKNQFQLLQPVFRAGELIYKLPSISDIRALSLEQQSIFQQVDLAAYPVGLALPLYERRMALIAQNAHA